jgi:hypothetical protein
VLSDWRGDACRCVVKRVLILSRPDDGHVACLTAEFDRLGASWIVCDPGAFPNTAGLTVRMDQKIDAQITLPDGQAFRVAEIGAVWYHHPSSIKADDALPELQRTFIEREGESLVTTLPSSFLNF